MAPASGETSSTDEGQVAALERRLSELEAAHEDLHELLAALGDAVVGTDLDGNVTYWNEAASRLLGGSAGDWLGRSLFDWFPRQELTRLFALYRQALDGAPQVLEWQDERNPATDLAVEVRFLARRPHSLQSSRLVHVFHDVTARRRVEDTMRRDALVLAQLQDAVVCTDTELCVVYWNEAAERIFGWRRDEMIGRSILTRLPAEVHEHVASIMLEIRAGRRTSDSQWEDYRKDGSRVWVSWRSQPITDPRGQVVGVVSVGSDMTERRAAERRKTELETQLFHAQKMETIGTLSSGIAHDFNNILAGILMQSEIALADQDAPPKLNAAVKEIRAAGLRAKALVRRILNFSRRNEPQRELVDVAALLSEVAMFVRATLPASIEIHVDLPANTRRVLADENRLYQVFVNLSSNAAAAMPEGGQLHFSLRESELVAPRQLATGLLPPGRYLEVSVTDTGSGMDAETRARMFEPFFTSKRPGEGTGLGLAIVASVMGEHGGAVDVESAPRAGSNIRVFLPVASVGPSARPTPTPARPLPRGTGEHILVLDDGESLTLLMRAALETLGYRVSQASSALDVTAALGAAPRAFDLIVIDQSMPELSGVELARRARAAGSELPIVIATGFAAPLDAQEAEGLRNLVVLEKPFEVEHLTRLIRRLLDATPAEPKP
jgi:PAS domain S-box-containing protein